MKAWSLMITMVEQNGEEGQILFFLFFCNLKGWLHFTCFSQIFQVFEVNLKRSFQFLYRKDTEPFFCFKRIHSQIINVPDIIQNRRAMRIESNKYSLF